jgi:ankyrin repeat protein
MNTAPAAAEPAQDLALVVAAGKGDIDAMTAALNNGAAINTAALGTTALSSAASSNQIEAIRFLLKHGADINAGAPPPNNMLGTPLQAALTGSHLEAAKVMLREANMMVDVNAPTVGPTVSGGLLGQVIFAGDAELLDLFLSHAKGIDPNKEEPITEWTVLDSTIVGKRPDLSKVLVTKLHGWKLRPKGLLAESTLFTAVEFGSVETVQAMLDNIPGIDLSATNKIGRTVLDTAANNPEMLKALLAYQAKVAKTQ